MCRWREGKQGFDSELSLAPVCLIELIQGIICLIIAKDSVFLMGSLRARALLDGSQHSTLQSQLSKWVKPHPSALCSSACSVSQTAHIQDTE